MTQPEAPRQSFETSQNPILGAIDEMLDLENKADVFASQGSPRLYPRDQWKIMRDYVWENRNPYLGFKRHGKS